MAGQASIQNELFQQQQNVDPFKVQRSDMFAKMAEPFQQGASPFAQASSFAQEQNQQGDKTKKNYQDLFKQDKQQAPDQKILRELKALGVDSEGIAFNQLGELNLNNRMKQAFGDDFMQKNPKARELMENFTGMLKSQGTKESMDSLLSRGKRTLAALTGG